MKVQDNYDHDEFDGLLDYFAAAAMQGLLASYSADAEIDGLEPRIASQSYDMADAMIAERSKR